MRRIANLKRILPRLLLPLVVAAIPSVLLVSSIRTFREIENLRKLYLQNRVALVAEQSDQKTRSLVEPILSETTRLENLVGDLLPYGRPPVASIRWVPWEETLAALKAHADALARAGQVHFSADSPPIEWRTDPALVEPIRSRNAGDRHHCFRNCRLGGRGHEAGRRRLSRQAPQQS